MNEFLGDRHGERRPAALADQVQHEVERGRAARSRVAVAVDDEKVARKVDVREFVAHRSDVLPVNGTAIAIEQSGARQDVAARAQPAELHALPCAPPQIGERRIIVSLRDIDAAAHEEHVEGAAIGDRNGRCNRKPVAGAHRLAGDAGRHPDAERVAAQTICHAKRLDRIRKRDHRVVRKSEEADTERLRRSAILGVSRDHGCTAAPVICDEARKARMWNIA